MFKKLLFLILTFFFISSAVLAQNYAKMNPNDWDDWDDDFFEWDDFHRPMIEFNYGFGEPKHKNFSADFAKTGLLELKLGYSNIYEEYGDYIVELKDKYFFGSKLANQLHSDEALSGEVTSELFRFGFGRREGFGYAFGAAAIIPYTQGAIVWSKLNKVSPDYEKFITDPASSFIDLDKKKDVEIINRYLGDFRFGTLAEGGVRFEVAGIIALNAGYEAAVIFPRHKVWKHLGSLALEGMGYWALDKFTKEIMDRVPAAGPIMNFILKNGFAYGFYLLKKDKMNWPFDTETPLTYETFKVGVTLTF